MTGNPTSGDWVGRSGELLSLAHLAIHFLFGWRGSQRKGNTRL